MYWTNECITSSSDLSDMEFINTKYFNKQPVVQFNSTVGKFVGFTELGVRNAERWNSGPDLQRMRSVLDIYCKPNLHLDYSYILDKAGKRCIYTDTKKTLEHFNRRSELIWRDTANISLLSEENLVSPNL